MKEFLIRSVIKSIDEYEDEQDANVLREVTDEDRANAIPWEEMEKKLGWDKL